MARPFEVLKNPVLCISLMGILNVGSSIIPRRRSLSVMYTCDPGRRSGSYTRRGVLRQGSRWVAEFLLIRNVVKQLKMGLKITWR